MTIDPAIIAQMIISLVAAWVGLVVGLWYRRPRAARPATPPPPPDTGLVMPVADKTHLLAATQRRYTEVLEHSANKFDQDLAATCMQINGQIKHLSTMVVAEELEQYRQSLVQLRRQAMDSMGEVAAAVEAQRQTMRADLVKEIMAEKARLVERLDAKLGEAVSSFLLEALRHKVDLGAQSQYLMSVLEENKAELKKEVLR